MSGERFEPAAGHRFAIAADIVDRAPRNDCVLGLHAISEFYVTVTRKKKLARSEAGCAAILTEDMADGSALFGVRIVNPVSGAALSPAAAALLGASAA